MGRREYEYRKIWWCDPEIDASMERLNEMGAMGWEAFTSILVGIKPWGSGWILLKRPVLYPKEDES